ncbi:MAG TPA: DsbA family oxidoreductase [Euzebyales bacterium]|nr:DsbA family oxidoreductase [Euzebyales bacterium]
MLVEIWSDVVCPWCAIGKVRFEQALAGLAGGDDVEVRYRSFQLDPTTPAVIEGDYVNRLAAKYRTSTARAQAMIDLMTAQAAAEGLAFDFSAARPGNTFDAHRLLHLAADRGVQHTLKGRLLAGYLSEGAAIGTHDALRRLATEAGLDGAEIDAVLGGDAYAEAVRADERQARAYGIAGVPFFVIDRRYGVSGAQPAEVLRRVMEQVRHDAPPATDQGPHAGHDPRDCADGSCAVA